MTEIIEPGDDIQVFIKNTGCCLWGLIQPVTRPDGGMLLILSVEPLPDTVKMVEAQGVKVIPDAHSHGPMVRHATVVIPKDAIDVIFGDDRHAEKV